MIVNGTPLFTCTLVSVFIRNKIFTYLILLTANNTINKVCIVTLHVFVFRCEVTTGQILRK